jgi:hypothetical protein
MDKEVSFMLRLPKKEMCARWKSCRKAAIFGVESGAFFGGGRYFIDKLHRSQPNREKESLP